MIENDRVLLTPAKRSNRFQVVVIKKVLRRELCERRVVAIQWPIHKLRCEKKTRCRNLREVKQRALVYARRDSFTHRIYKARDPLVVLGAIDPRRQVPTRFHFRRERQKP